MVSFGNGPVINPKKKKKGVVTVSRTRIGKKHGGGRRQKENWPVGILSQT